MSIEFKLSFTGSLADRKLLSGYDASMALGGFERTLALTTHAVLNGNIIVQAPALKGANILFSPPEEGSWTTRAIVVIGGLWALNNVEQHSPIGHLLYSAYDYVIHHATGGDLDYDKPIRRLIEDARDAAPEANPNLSVDVLDAVIERSEKSIEQMHRPIIETKTAETAIITSSYYGSRAPIILDRSSYEYISRSIERKSPERFVGAVSSYNMNSFTGRLFIPELHRTVAFMLGEQVRSSRHVQQILNSLQSNALRFGNETMAFEALGRVDEF